MKSSYIEAAKSYAADIANDGVLATKRPVNAEKKLNETAAIRIASNAHCGNNFETTWAIQKVSCQNLIKIS